VSESTTRKIVRNSAFNILRGVIALPIALIITPLVLARVGIRDFGIWSVLYVLIQSASLFDFGLSGSIVRFVAELNEKRDFSQLNRVLNTALSAYAFLGLIVFSGVWLCRKVIVVGLFKAEPWEQQKLVWLLILAAVALVVQLLCSVFLAVLQGLQRMDLANLISVMTYTLHFGLVVYALKLGFGIATLVAIQCLTVALGLVASIAASKQALPSLQWSSNLISFDALKTIMPLSLAVQCLSVQTMVFFQFDKLVLSGFLGPTFAGCYDIAARPLTSLRNLPLTILQPVVPAVSELQARRDRTLIQEVFLHTNKYVLLTAAPIFMLLIFLPSRLLSLWFGNHVLPNADIVALTLQLLAATYLVNLMGGTITYVALGLGHHVCLFRYAVIAAVLHIALTLLFVTRLGYVGAPLGALTATIVSVFYYGVAFSRGAGFPASPILRLAVKPVGVAGLLGVLTLALTKTVPSVNTPLHLSLLVILYFLLFVAAMWGTGYINREDLQNLRSHMRGFDADLILFLKTSIKGMAKRLVKVLTLPERYLKSFLLHRYASRETSDDLKFRNALLWGWGLDRTRRNLAVAARVREISNESSLTVLDVGASDLGVGHYLSQERFRVCNVDLDWKRLATNGTRSWCVAADGCRLPFSDGAFDVVVSVDCLEHVPPEKRGEYLRELKRVARKRLVLHFPALGSQDFQSSPFEARFRAIYWLTFRRDSNIEEHLQNGLPDVRQVADHFPGCAIFGRENAHLWLMYMLLNRIPYLGFFTGLFVLPFRRRLDSSPYHAALLVYDKERNPGMNPGDACKNYANQVMANHELGASHIAPEGLVVTGAHQSQGTT
jgi:O-antigen/teichoic acid export membrane protein